MFLTVKYSCQKCGIEKRPVIVAERRASESTKDFVAYVAEECCADHRRKSPRCHVSTLTGLMIPIHDTKGIGFNPEPKKK